MRVFPDADDPAERDTPVGSQQSRRRGLRGSAFFEDIRQIDIMIGEQPAKSPTFYYDGSYIAAAFPARYRRLRQLMPDPRYVPARLAPGLGVVSIACLENRDTYVGPYREVAIQIPLNEPYFRANLPGRALMSATRLGQVHVFIPHMPATTELAVRAALNLFNGPSSSRKSTSRRPMSCPGVVCPRERSTSSLCWATGSRLHAASGLM